MVLAGGQALATADAAYALAVEVLWTVTAPAVNLYDGEIFYWDEQFKALLDELEALSLLDRTVIVVTADHGEEFFDHGGLGHGWTLYEELLHVPLLIRLPRHRGGARVAAPVDTAGLFDTVAAIMGCDPPPFTQCKGLLPPDRIPGRYPRLFAATECNAPEAEARWACVFEPPFKYIRDMGGDRCFLFRLDRDPGEHRDLASALSTEAERLRKVLEAWYADTAAAFPGEWQPFTREMEKGFETLGYVDRGIRANRREDGLYHSYNLLDFSPDGGRVEVVHLEEMLEGQVAVLNSDLLDPEQSLEILDVVTVISDKDSFFFEFCRIACDTGILDSFFDHVDSIVVVG